MDMDEFGRAIPQSQEEPEKTRSRSRSRSRSRANAGGRRASEHPAPRSRRRSRSRRGTSRSRSQDRFRGRRDRERSRRPSRSRDDRRRRFRSRSRSPSESNQSDASGGSSPEREPRDLAHDIDKRMSALAEQPPCMSYRDFVNSLKDGERAIKDEHDLESSYEEYVEEWRFKSSAAYFALHRQEAWFQARYNAEILSESKKKKKAEAQKNASNFMDIVRRHATEGPESFAKCLPEILEVASYNYKNEYHRTITEADAFENTRLLALREVPLWVTPTDVFEALSETCKSIGPQQNSEVTSGDDGSDETMRNNENGDQHDRGASPVAPPIEVYHSDPLRSSANPEHYSIWVEFPSEEAATAVLNSLNDGKLQVNTRADIVSELKKLQGVQQCRINEIVDTAQVEIAKEHDMDRIRTSLEEHPSVVEELVHLSAANQKKTEEKSRKRLEELAKNLDRQQRKFIKLVNKRIHDMKKSDPIVKLKRDITLQADDTESSHSITIPPPRQHARSITLSISKGVQIERKPLPDICSQTDQVAQHFNRALLLARALDIEAELSSLPSFLENEESLRDTTTGERNETLSKLAQQAKANLSAVHVLTTNYWLEYCETNVDTVLHELDGLLRGSDAFGNVQRLDSVIMYLQKVHYFDFYRGTQCNGYGDYLATLGNTRIRRLVTSKGLKENTSQSLEPSENNNTDTANTHVSDNGNTEGLDSSNVDGAVEEAHHESIDQHGTEEAQDNNMGGNAEEKDEKSSMKTSGGERDNSRACGAVSDIHPQNKRQSFQGRPQSLTLTEIIELRTQIRLRTARRRIARSLAESIDQLSDVEEQAIQMGEQMEKDSSETPQLFAVLEFPDLEKWSKGIAREISRFQPVHDFNDLENRAEELKKQVENTMNNLTDAQLLEPWYLVVCRSEEKTKTATEEAKSICTICEKRFKARRFVIKHIHNKHPKEAEVALRETWNALERLVKGSTFDPDTWARYFADPWRPLFVLHTRRHDDEWRSYEQYGQMRGQGARRMPRGPPFSHRMAPRGMGRGFPGMPMQMPMHPRGRPMAGPRPQMMQQQAMMMGGRGFSQGARFRDYDAPQRNVSTAPPQFGKPDYGSSLVSYDDI